MAMTEKQGGSDLRANVTRAEPQEDGSYAITGHKWFCTIVNCDFFFTLAQAPEGLSCFVMEKDSGFRVVRLKDKLGGRAIASSEVEFEGARAWLVGEEGRGVPTLTSTLRVAVVVGHRYPLAPLLEQSGFLAQRGDRRVVDRDRAARRRVELTHQI